MSQPTPQKPPTAPEADAYYDDVEITSEELDLSFLDETPEKK